VAATPASPRAALHSSWLGIAALLAQIWIVYFVETEGAPGLARRILLPLTIGLLLVFALRNRHLWGVRVMAVGFLLNLLVISANGGLMPVSPDQVVSANLQDRVGNVQLGHAVPGSKGILMASHEARLWYLSDIFVFPPHSPVARVLSVGDFLVLGGLLTACAEVIQRSRHKRRARDP
jgi:hypothetical protein